MRAATSALLEQQRSLARAERLAATGELAASVAHGYCPGFLFPVSHH